MKRPLFLSLQRRLRRYRLIVKPTLWLNCHLPYASYPFFWMAVWATFRYLYRHPFGTVWIIPRGRITARFRKKDEKLRRRVAAWTFDPYDPWNRL